ncbi:ester cyclase [Aureimonas altamirensis]|uniref:ester cyclase n=1 Tax=Aureimonas altamirensis TaxID=370622 RepID=UPI0020373F0E|nr:ester cyclase [Aureimonas altamirensis]MCM2504723.1 ester cyclase [Aureimonas altamirensis]
MKRSKSAISLAAGVLAIAAVSGPALAQQSGQSRWPESRSGQPVPTVEGMPKELAERLSTFDDLDFRVYTNQQWDDLHKSHAENIVVHYPDGHTTTGIPDHIKELSGMWTFAPDNRITQHPVRFGTADGEWTAVMGYLDGTFTQPMDLGNGKVIQPTGKAYHLPMATLGHWNKDGAMDEEYLFWDNSTLMQQIGVAP